MNKIQVNAYGKINLGLHILGKRPDGYHTIETVFHPINLFDSITIAVSEGEGLRITCSDSSIPTDKMNLCYQAAEKFLRRIDPTKGVSISLEKNIPVGAGLGGGSSDAAAVLRGLNKIHNGILDEKTLLEVASQIGSDVPYFIKGGTVYATGKGEILEQLPFQLPYWIVVVFPGFSISTRWAYESFQLNPYIKNQDFKKLVEDNVFKPSVWVNMLRNDLEPVVFNAYPDVMHIKKVLVKSGADFALMSGSGSSVFGLYQQEDFALEIMEHLRKQYKVWVTEPLFTLHI